MHPSGGLLTVRSERTVTCASRSGRKRSSQARCPGRRPLRPGDSPGGTVPAVAWSGRARSSAGERAEASLSAAGPLEARAADAERHTCRGPHHRNDSSIAPAHRRRYFDTDAGDRTPRFRFSTAEGRLGSTAARRRARRAELSSTLVKWLPASPCAVAGCTRPFSTTIDEPGQPARE